MATDRKIYMPSQKCRCESTFQLRFRFRFHTPSVASACLYIQSIFNIASTNSSISGLRRDLLQGKVRATWKYPSQLSNYWIVYIVFAFHVIWLALAAAFVTAFECEMSVTGAGLGFMFVSGCGAHRIAQLFAAAQSQQE